MAEEAWADVTGDLETLVALSLPAMRADAGRVYLTLRDSYHQVGLVAEEPVRAGLTERGDQGVRVELDLC